MRIASAIVAAEPGETSMNQVPDRKKLRRTYLRLRWKQRLQLIAGTSIALIAFFGLTVFGHRILDHVREHPDISTALKAMGVTAALLAGYFLCARIGQRMIRSAQEMNVAYVPPATPNTLPAEEILVRGAAEPTAAHSDVLLRAAQGEQATPKEDLLRASQGERS